MDVPRHAGDVGWYASGPQPGQPGDAVIDGHLDWTSGPAVFWDLDKLRPGDSIQIIDHESQTMLFQVTSMATFPADGRPPAGLFTAAGPSRLSLITCAGEWKGGQYSQRLVVTAAGAGVGVGAGG
jgi:sortase (surface protein transpeptidase)